ATKLDLSSEINIKASNYQHMIYGSDRGSQALYSENATLGFVIKDIRLEKTRDSKMDVGVVLKSAGVGSASDTVKAPQLQDGINRLPNTNGTPFVKEAYVKIYRFIRPTITATLGRQAFTLGQGMTLSDDGLGMPGAKLEAQDLFFKRVKTEMFFFRPFKDLKYYKVYGVSAYYPSNEGLWHIYHFWENEDAPDVVDPANTLLYDTISKTKKFTGLRYFLNYNALDFDGELVLQRGQAKTAGETIDYAAYAFLIKGAWNQNISFFGRSRARLAYGRASGNSNAPAGTDKAFFPTFGRKYDGIERSGFGAIAGATLYDTIKTSSTPNGLPYGVSGLNVISLGVDLPYKKLMISADFYRFKASQNISGGSLQIGSETDLKAVYKLGEDLQLNAIYAVFTPLSLYTQTTPITLVSTTVSARF
ncbi:MAG TPA: hypothetical protein DCG50_05800, partial [Elusimicrobia bacterium]|nr:hypothetical protein [Elusimicrobiota bacterium]